MEIFIYTFVFIFGLAIGSLLNCIIHRLFTKENFLVGKSHCPSCKHTLSWKDLFPVLSFLILKGKCRYCSQRISWQYPLVELATALLFVLIVNQQLASSNQELIFLILNICFLFLVASLLIIIFVYDLKHYIIPDKVIYPAILVTGSWYLVASIFFNIHTRYKLLTTLYSAFTVAAFFLAIVLLSRGKGMGVGDIKLAFFMGLFLGYPKILVAVFLAFLIGAIVGLVLIGLSKKSLKSEIPFAPFLVLGTFLAMFWGEQLIDFYFNFFLLK